MSLISPNFDVKSIIFSQLWPGAFPKIAGNSPERICDQWDPMLPKECPSRLIRLRGCAG